MAGQVVLELLLLALASCLSSKDGLTVGLGTLRLQKRKGASLFTYEERMLVLVSNSDMVSH